MRKLQELRKSNIPWALVVSTFINKSGEMAMNLFPMLLIEHHFTTSGATLTMGLVKTAQVTGLYFGGLLCDYFGYRYLILAAFLSGAIGFTSIPFLKSTLLITCLGVFAQFGAALFNASARSMIRETSGSVLKQNMAWLRMASNLGQVISALLGIVFGSIGLIFPFLVDGVTSFFAFVVGVFALKDPPRESESEKKGMVHKGFFIYTFALVFFFFIYDLGTLSFSGFAKMSLGSNSIQAFSIVMLVNTFICGTLAVPAARLFRNPKKAILMGSVTVAVGMILLVSLPKTIPYFALCALIMTCGEVVWGVYAQTLLLANSTGRSSRHYGLSLMIQTLGRFAAGVCVFPFVLRAEFPVIPFLVGLIGFMFFYLKVPKEFMDRAQ